MAFIPEDNAGTGTRKQLGLPLSTTPDPSNGSLGAFEQGSAELPPTGFLLSPF
jgi:hypothetical protein